MHSFTIILKPPRRLQGTELNCNYHFQNFQARGIDNILNDYLLYPRQPQLRSFSGEIKYYRDDQGQIHRPAGYHGTIHIHRPFTAKHFLNDNCPNLLYIANIPAGVKSFKIQLDTNQFVSYCALTPEVARQHNIHQLAKCPLWQEYTSLPRCLFLQEMDRPRFSVDLALEIQIHDDQEYELTDDFQLNPIWLVLPVDGDQIADQVFQDLLNDDGQSNLLRLEPLFADSLDSRIHFYRHGQRKLDSRQPAHASTIENLIWQQHQEHSWKAFAALDIMRGEFWAVRNRENHMVHLWFPPERELKANEQFFTDYWLQQWNGQRAPAEWMDSRSQMHKIAQPSYASLPVYPSRVGGKKLSGEQLQEACSQSRNLFDNFVKSRTLAFEFICEMLDEPGMGNSPAQQLFRGYLMLDREGEDFYLHFDDLNYLTQFCEQYIVPLSPIAITFPSLALEAENDREEKLIAAYEENLQTSRFLNLTTSPYLGAQRLFVQLCRHWKSSELNAAEKIVLLMRAGWWNYWYESLFSHPHTTPIHPLFVETGFILNQSLLGETKLGSAKQYYEQSPEIYF